MKSIDQRGVAPILILVAVIGVITFLALSWNAPFKNDLLSTLYPKDESQAAFVAPTPIPGCVGGNITPIGQANPSMEYEPMGNIWCYPLNQMPTTRVTGANDWIDEFNTNVQMGRFEDGDMDYRIFNSLSADASPEMAKHWVNANHWMTDTKHPSSGQATGIMMRPNRSFKFENGKLIVEADVAHQIPEYGGRTWPEIGWSTAPQPSLVAPAVEPVYIYGAFQGDYAAGCRMQGSHGIVCAGRWNSPNMPAGALGRCGSLDNGRIYEGQGGGWSCATRALELTANSFPAATNPIRICQNNQMDIFCRDRFRFIWSKDGIEIYTNGVKTYEYGGIPASNQWPDSIVNGTTPVYVYFGEHSSANATSVRVHWDRLAVNPKDVGNHIMPATQAPGYCPGQPQNTCPIIPTQDPQKPAISNKDVEILDFVFDPGNITIKAGDTVTWTNKTTTGQSHSVVADDNSWQSPIFGLNQTYQRKFDTPGTYSYYCLPHPNMVGTITVVPADGTTPSSTPTPSVAPSPSVVPSPSPSPSFVAGAVYYTTMDGARNVPQITTNGTGYSQITLSQDEKTAKVTLYYKDLTSTNTVAHIHGPADSATNVAALFGLVLGTPGQLTTTTINNLTTQQVTDLKNGLWYVNVHSNNYPSGEIRGQYALVPANKIVYMNNQFSYSPATIGANVGEGILWINNDTTDHTVTADNNSFNSGMIPPGGSYMRTFSQSGSVAYHCDLHLGMTGTVTIGSGSPIPTPSGNKPGDINGNGRVDIFDYNLLLTDFGATSGVGLRSDINKNGRVDIFDYNLLLTNFGK